MGSLPSFEAFEVSWAATREAASSSKAKAMVKAILVDAMTLEMLCKAFGGGLKRFGSRQLSGAKTDL